jgi:hypothetical protein
MLVVVQVFWVLCRGHSRRHRQISSRKIEKITLTTVVGCIVHPKELEGEKILWDSEIVKTRGQLSIAALAS